MIYVTPLTHQKSIKNWVGEPTVTFEQGLSQTIDWYLNNEDWLKNVTSGNYQNYYNKQYS